MRLSRHSRGSPSHLQPRGRPVGRRADRPRGEPLPPVAKVRCVTVPDNALKRPKPTDHPTPGEGSSSLVELTIRAV